MLLRLFTLLLVLAGTAGPLQGQSRVEPVLPARIEAGAPFQLQFLAENMPESAQPLPPSWNGLLLVSGPRLYKGTRQTTGGPRTVVNYTYTLIAPRKGVYRIGSFSLLSAERNVSTLPISLTVVDANTASPVPTEQLGANLYGPPAGDAEAFYREQLFLRVEVDRRTVYPGQPVVATYKIYSRLPSVSQMLKSPGFYGFDVVEMISLNEQPEGMEVVNGQTFHTTVLRKAQLYPARSGMLEVDPIYVASSISFLDSVTGEPLPEVQRQLESAPVPVRVRELPAENRPAGFSGATGKFTVSARLLHDNLRQQEAGRLLVTVGGAGNFLQLQPPEVPWPAGVEAFPPAITDRLKRNTVPVTGQRTFTFSFVADRPGAYAIPPVRLSFFDPETAAYQTLQTDTLRFQVRAGGVPAPASGKGRTGGSGPAGWLIALGLLVLLGVVVWLLRSRKKRPAPAPVVNTEPQTDYPAAIRALSAAGGAQTAAALEALLHRYARARWRLQGNGPLAAQLAQAGVPEGEVQEWKAVLEGCQRMAYGDGGVDLEALKERAVRLVSGA